VSIDELRERIASLEKQQGETRDRQEIRDIVTRYVHAIDRLDRELFLSCYHPDAVNDFGVFFGSSADLADWAFAAHRKYQTLTSHNITNHLCDLQGDLAHALSYYFSAEMNCNGTMTLLGGRYIDRFERRGRKWGIAARVHRLEWCGTPWEMPPPRKKEDAADMHESRRDRADPSYQRPLVLQTNAATYEIVGI
jgi:hypothetical protein